MADQPKTSSTEFEQQAGQSRPSLFKEFMVYLFTNKKWWLTPIILLLLLLGLIAVLSGTVAAPLIYTLF